MPKKETWSAINSPKITLIRGVARRQGIGGGGKIIATEPVPISPPPLRAEDAWDDRVIPLEIGAFTTEIEKWRERYKEAIHQTREDKDPDMEETARKKYASEHGDMVKDAKKMNIPNLEVLAERLSTRNMSTWEAHLLGVTCLHGKKPQPQENESEKQFKKREQLLDWYGITFLKKAHFLSRGNPLHPYSVKIELERLFEKYELGKLKDNKDELRVNLRIYAHDEGKEQFTVHYYYEQVKEWAARYVEDIMSYQDRKYEEKVRKGAVNISEEALEFWREESQDLQRRFEGGHKEHIRVVMMERKQTNAYFKYMFENNEGTSAYFLYRNLALPALRNPRDSKTIKEKNPDELIGFEILKEAYNRASNDPSNLKDYKGFYAYIIMAEYINKWMGLRDENGKKIQSGPSVKNRAYQILEAAFMEWKNKTNPLPSINTTRYAPNTNDEIPR